MRRVTGRVAAKSRGADVIETHVDFNCMRGPQSADADLHVMVTCAQAAAVHHSHGIRCIMQAATKASIHTLLFEVGYVNA